MAANFRGVIFGLWITQNPLILYTLYGVVPLAGIVVNAAIVLISAANDRLRAGMSPLHTTVYAARRRVISIITTATTVAGLFSLATELEGVHSYGSCCHLYNTLPHPPSCHSVIRATHLQTRRQNSLHFFRQAN